MFAIIMIVVMAIFAIVLFLPRLVQKNSIVINTKNGLVRECDVPFLVPRIDLLSFFQMKLVGIYENISKRFDDAIARFKLQFRDKVSYKLCVLRKVRCRGPFLGMRFGAIEASIS